MLVLQNYRLLRKFYYLDFYNSNFLFNISVFGKLWRMFETIHGFLYVMNGKDDGVLNLSVLSPTSSECQFLMKIL